MLGRNISDPDNSEEGGEMRGMELLPLDTTLLSAKTRKQVTGLINDLGGIFEGLSGKEYEGYEIHMGDTVSEEEGRHPVVVHKGNIYGSYIHSIFDKGSIATEVVKALAEKKGVDISGAAIDYAALKEREYDRLADVIRKHMDMDKIYAMLNEAHIAEE